MAGPRRRSPRNQRKLPVSAGCLHAVIAPAPRLTIKTRERDNALKDVMGGTNERDYETQTGDVRRGRGGRQSPARSNRVGGAGLEWPRPRAERFDSGAALEAVHSGRIRRIRRQHQEIQRTDRRQGARRRRELGRHPAQGGGRGQCRRRPGHHHGHQRRSVQIPGQAAGHDRSGRLPRRQIRRLVPGRQDLRHARQEVDRPAAGRHGRLYELSRRGDARRRDSTSFRKISPGISSCARA